MVTTFGPCKSVLFFTNLDACSLLITGLAAADICFINGVVSLVGSSPSGQVQCERYAEKEVSASHPGTTEYISF